MDKNIQTLILIAEKKIAHSHDPVHDLQHVKRVVDMVNILSEELDISEKHRSALILAAWWHDVSRTVTRKPSMVIMALMDDLLSAMMLWFYTIRCGVFGSVAGMSTRIIWCKSFGAGKLFTRIFLRKKTRILLDILHDADMMDVLHVERMEKVLQLVEQSYAYHVGYKVLAWWNFNTNQLKPRTEVARKYLKRILAAFRAWINTYLIRHWHIEHYGNSWVYRVRHQIETLSNRLYAS